MLINMNKKIDHKIRYGLVGYGLNAIGHRWELTLHPRLRKHTELIAGFDPGDKGKERLKKLEKKGKIKAANSYEDLLDTPNLDAVIICSPPQFHAQQAVSALESGIHVYSEVPMAIEEKDIERIIQAEEQSDASYMLGENYCYLSEVLYAGALASSGKIGPTVYAESEYLHDVTYRWREGNSGGPEKPRVDAFYQLFDPLMYAHSIGPAQVALGGIEKPMKFEEVVSYANDIGGYKGEPICKPSKAFHVALFKTPTGANAKCANAYIFAREPMRLSIQVTGRTGTYECYEMGKAGRIFLADDHIITKLRHRKGKSKRVGKFRLSKEVDLRLGSHHGSGTRIFEEWIASLKEGKKSNLNARAVANMCEAGIAASKSARNGGKKEKIKLYEN